MNFDEVKLGMQVSIEDDDLPNGIVYIVKAKVEYTSACSIGLWYSHPSTGCDEVRFVNVNRVVPVK